MLEGFLKFMHNVPKNIMQPLAKLGNELLNSFQEEPLLRKKPFLKQTGFSKFINYISRNITATKKKK